MFFSTPPLLFLFYIFYGWILFFLSFYSIYYLYVKIKQIIPSLWFSSSSKHISFFPIPVPIVSCTCFQEKKQKTGDVMSWFKIQSCAYMWVYMQLYYSLCKFFKELCIDAYKKRTYMRIKKVKEGCLSDELRLSEHILNISNMSQK